MKAYIIIFFFIIGNTSIISCSNSSDRRIENELLKAKSDTLIKDIPESEVSVLIYREWTRTLGLTSIENGSSDFEMRIWEDIDNSSGRVVIIRRFNEKWIAEMFNYEKKTTTWSFRDSLSGEKKILNDPKSGWTNFLNKLLDLDILSLPDSQKLPNYFVSTDETSVRIEIARKNYYRVYEYPDPYIRQGYPTARKMTKILKFLKEEFSLTSSNS